MSLSQVVPAQNYRVSDTHNQNTLNSLNLVAFVVAARMHGCNCDPEGLAREIGISPDQFDRRYFSKAANAVGLRLRKASKRGVQQLLDATFPILSETFGNGLMVVTKLENDVIFFLNPEKPQTLQSSRVDDFEVFSVSTHYYFSKLVDSDKPFGFEWFISEALRHKRAFVEVLTSSFLVQILSLVPPFATQIAIDKVLAHKNESILGVLAAALAISLIFEVVLTYIQGYLTAHTASKVDARLGGSIYRHMLTLGLPYFEQRRVGDSVARIKEVETIRQFITGSSISAVLDAIFASAFMAILFFYSPTLSAIVLISIPLYLIVIVSLRPQMRRLIEARFNENSRTQSFLVESISGIHTIKSLTIDKAISARWELMLSKYILASFKVSNLSGAINALTQFVQRLTTLAILVYGSQLVLGDKLTIGELVAFQMIATRAVAPLVRLLQLGQELQQVGLSVDRLGDLMNVAPESGTHGVPSPRISGRVSFRNVGFSYPGSSELALKSLSLEIPAGTSVGVVGRSGSGKSTLTKLLQKLYLPTSGNIEMDSIDISSIENSSLRRQIGVVLQDNFLFDGTILENIKVQNPSAPGSHIEAVIRLSGAAEFVSRLPLGLQTQVGERGVTISGGQRQRIAIARALLNDPKILILDEATSALDSESETLIRNNLKEMSSGRTVFIVAHRLSTVKHCDQIIVLERGQVVERGTHTSLLELCGTYRNLHDQQA